MKVLKRTYYVFFILVVEKILIKESAYHFWFKKN